MRSSFVRRGWYFAAAASFLAAASLAAAAELEEQAVFTAGKDGYHTYRIPSAIVSPKGTVLAFCEGRKKGTSDAGDIDLVLKRSFDGGLTWQAQQLVWDDADN